MSTSLPNAHEFHAACVCLGLNRAARVTARRYDAALRPVGLTSGQFSILSALAGGAQMSIGGMATLLGLERTTLTRNLLPLQHNGLVRIAEDDQDRRQRTVTASKEGLELLERAFPLWQEAQKASQKRLGETPWRALKSKLDDLT